MSTFISNEEYENENRQADEIGQEDAGEEKDANVVSFEPKKRKRPAFAEWNVGGRKLKLKLTTDQVLELEKQHRKNLLALLGDEDNIPPLTTMLQVIHAAAQPWAHGIKLKNIIELYDRYQEQGGTQLNLYVDVYIQIFVVSGFFSDSIAEDVSDSMGRVQESI